MRNFLNLLLVIMGVWMTCSNTVFADELVNKSVTTTVTIHHAPDNPEPYFSKKGNDGYYFDAARYANDYPDVAAAIGYDKIDLWNHYKLFGLAEGRKAWTTNDKINAQIKIQDVAATITYDSMTDREKVKAVHDWIINNTVYDYQNYLDGTIPDESYEIEGVINKGIGVCSGYARTFKAFMDLLGIPCDCVIGMANNGGHSWNRVFIDNNYLYIDTCWDDPIMSDGSNGLFYDYFLISYEQMSIDHVQTEIE